MWLRAERMDDANLSWFPDRGFVLAAEVTQAPVALRFMDMPLPADGTVELREGVELDRLDLMFKAQVELGGEPGLLLGCTVTLCDVSGATAVKLSGEVEDTETGDTTPLTMTLGVKVPNEAPKAGGPRPEKMDEDELDWQDETTLDEIVLPPPPEPKGGKKAAEPGAKGYERLLAALASMDDDEDYEIEDEPPPGEDASTPAPPPPPRPTPPPADPTDQSLGADDEARGFLELLIRGDSLELEDGASIEGLLEGTKHILKGRGSSEAKAGKLSTWLLDQDSVADLYIADEELASLLEQW